MCSAALYRAIGERRAPEGKASPERPVRLGDWAAVLVDKTVVVAIEERTCLTLVFQIRPLVRRRHPALVEALEFAECEAGAHVGGGQEEGSVQDMLNEYPCSGCPASCPKDAVTTLFAGRAGARQPAKPGVPAPTVTRG